MVARFSLFVHCRGLRNHGWLRYFFQLKRFYEMRHHKSLWVVFLLLGVGVANAQSTQTQPPPSLVTEAGGVSASRGSDTQRFQIASKILKETRRILVALPPSYSQSAPDRRYPVTVVVDGEYLIAAVASVSDELARNGQIPESVIVGIENVGGPDFAASNMKRVYDLTPPGLSVSGSGLNEGGDRFLDFIEQELLPAVDRQFRTAAPRVFVGISSGGILATYVAATRSTYCAVVCLDAPIHLGENWLAKKLIARAGAAPPPVRYASLEARFGWPDDTWKTLVANAPANWKLHREKFWPKESHESIQMIGAYLGLREVFGDYSMLAAPKSPTTSILPFYAKVSASLGAAVMPPRKLLRNVVDDLLMEGRGAAAREAYNTLVSGYGAPTDSATMLSKIVEVERQPPPSETVEGLRRIPSHHAGGADVRLHERHASARRHPLRGQTRWGHSQREIAIRRHKLQAA